MKPNQNQAPQINLPSILRGENQPAAPAVDPRDQTIAELTKQVQTLTNAVTQLQGTPQQIPTTPQAPHAQVGDVRYVGRREFADAFDDPNTLADVVNNAIAQALQPFVGIQDSLNTDKIVEQVYQQVNSGLDSRIASRVVTNNIIADFYQTNPEMTPFKQQLATVIQNIESKEPGLSVEELLTKGKEAMYTKHKPLLEAAKETLNKQPDPAPTATTTPPAQPDPNAVTPPAGTPSNPIAAMVAKYRPEAQVQTQ